MKKDSKRTSQNIGYILCCFGGIAIFITIIIASGYYIWRLPKVRNIVYINLMLNAPKTPVRLKSIDSLLDYPTKQTVSALITLLNSVDYKRDQEVGLRALNTLSLITKLDFGNNLEGNRYNYSYTTPSSEDWPQILMNINTWLSKQSFNSLRFDPVENGTVYWVPRHVKRLLDKMASEQPEIVSGKSRE